MVRKPRVFVPGAIYHVYNRISSGEPVFLEEEEALELIERMVEVRERDGWRVLAWCLMSNHYHLVVRSGEVPLWRGLHRIQNLFSRRYNRRKGRTGPLWQSRYRAKVIADQHYLGQVILYVHLNPVRAGVAAHPARYRYSGHVEIVGKESWRMTDVNQSLLCFGEKRSAALRRYQAAVSAALATESEETAQETVAQRGETEDELWYDVQVPYVDALGRSTALERPEISAAEFVRTVAGLLGVDPQMIAGRSRNRSVSRARRLTVLLGVERWRLRGRDLAQVLDRTTDVVSWMVGRAVRDRLEDDSFQEKMDELDRRLAKLLIEATGEGMRG